MHRPAHLLAALLAVTTTATGAERKEPPSKPTPTCADISYGPSPLQLVDVHVPTEGNGPFPVLIWFGGLWKPAKGVPDLNHFVPHGVAVIGVQMRTMTDAAKWNLDTRRIAVGGGSQGALPALYVGCSPDRANPQAADPVERVSTKVTCVAAYRSQPSIDPKRMQQWVPGVMWGVPALGCSFEESLKRHEELMPLIKQWSPDWLLHKAAAPIYFENNWLLREFDKHVKSLPAADQLSGGIPKTNLIHTLCYSYGAHDVPPNFNFDHRVRMCVSGYTSHRGQGKWLYCNSFNDVMRAMQVMLPQCDMSQYWVYIVSFPSSDWGLNTMGDAGFLTPEDVYSRVHDNFYAVGGRNLGVEMDVDFGKNGLTYYMYAKMFWEPTMSLAQLQALRDRWILRSYGAEAAGVMSQYYDLMSPRNFVSSPNMWAMAIRCIQQADAVTPDGTPEKQRLNDLKQFWYYYYLQDHVMSRSGSWPGNMKANIEPAIIDKVKEFLWKGQTSYITPLYCFTWGMFRAMDKKGNIPSIYEVCSPTWYDTNKKYIAPAHYTEAETAGWWADVVKYFPYTTVCQFQTSRLSNGKLGWDVDLNNLTAIREFRGEAPGDGTFIYMPNHAAQPAPLVTAQNAGDAVGLKVFSFPGNPPTPFVITYTVDRWDPTARAWQKDLYSRAVASANDGLPTKSHEVASLTFSNTVARGIYRFNLGEVAGGAITLSSPDYDTRSNTFSGDSIAQGLTLTQRLGYVYVVPIGYIYIPKGTTTLDLETWDDANPKTIDLYTGLPSGSTPWKLSRTVDIHGRGPHRIPLNPGEAGSIACMNHGGTAVPYFYSIPNIWAKQPWMLMVPEDIAKADGLTSYLPPFLPPPQARSTSIISNNCPLMANSWLDNRAESLDRAIQCFKAAFRVQTEGDIPKDWAKTQHYLGLAIALSARRPDDAFDVESLSDALRRLRAASECYRYIGLESDAKEADEFVIQMEGLMHGEQDRIVL
jgi:hypothetical protein